VSYIFCSHFVLTILLFWHLLKIVCSSIFEIHPSNQVSSLVSVYMDKFSPGYIARFCLFQIRPWQPGQRICPYKCKIIFTIKLESLRSMTRPYQRRRRIYDAAVSTTRLYLRRGRIYDAAVSTTRLYLRRGCIYDALSKQRNLSCKTKTVNNLWFKGILKGVAILNTTLN
jgi:hypothetical protein